MPQLQAGRLRHRVTIQERIDTQDPADGTNTTTWQDLFTNIAAEVVPVSVREFIGSQAMQSDVTARITIRYRAGLTAAMRVLHGSKIYNPQGWLADPESGVEYLTAPCSEGVNQGA